MRCRFNIQRCYSPAPPSCPTHTYTHGASSAAPPNDTFCVLYTVAYELIIQLIPLYVRTTWNEGRSAKTGRPLTQTLKDPFVRSNRANMLHAQIKPGKNTTRRVSTTNPHEKPPRLARFRSVLVCSAAYLCLISVHAAPNPNQMAASAPAHASSVHYYVRIMFMMLVTYFIFPICTRACVRACVRSPATAPHTHSVRVSHTVRFVRACAVANVVVDIVATHPNAVVSAGLIWSTHALHRNSILHLFAESVRERC